MPRYIGTADPIILDVRPANRKLAQFLAATFSIGGEISPLHQQCGPTHSFEPLTDILPHCPGTATRV
jgi:hypothetical protein